MEVEDVVINYFNEQKGVVAVFLFGSVAEGRSTTASDVDLAVLFRRDSIPQSLKIMQMREDISDLINRKVDLVCLNGASPIIGMQVVRKGKRLVLEDGKAFDEYFSHLITDYSDLKIVRKPMEDSIKERKYYDR